MSTISSECRWMEYVMFENTMGLAASLYIEQTEAVKIENHDGSW